MTGWKPRVVVIGAGAGGIAAAARLLEDGIDDLVVVDRADGVGGVWRANTYPGARCDVPSHLYSLSFHPNPDWSQRFAEGPEILDYLESAATGHGVADRLLLRTEVVACRWDDDAAHWWVRLRGPDGVEVDRPADVVVAATGQLSLPHLPEIPGLDSFTGPEFHSARWEHDVDVTGKRVAVLGTGASAAQFVPALAGRAARVTVFQRTAPYIIGRMDRRYSRLERLLFARIPAALRGSRLRQYLWHELLGTPFTLAPKLTALPEWIFRVRLRRAVPDPELRGRLTPGYRIGCKRLLRAPDWYATISRPDVELVSEPIAAVVPEGVRTADGALHEADVIVHGTGFAATAFLAPIEVTGRGGRSLADAWRGGAHAYLGTAVAGFPNLFMVYGPGTNLGHSSVLFMIECQLTWIRAAVRMLRERDLGWVDVTAAAQATYDREFRRASSRSVWESGCSSWYTVDGRNTNNWPGTTVAFRRRTRQLRLTDLEVGPRPATGGGAPDRLPAEVSVGAADLRPADREPA